MSHLGKLADAVESDDLEIAGDLEALDLDVDAAEPASRDGREDKRDIDDEDERFAAEGDLGDLYGVHTPRAADTALTADEDQDGFAGAEDGENWMEALEIASTEGGPTPEHEVSVRDDSDSDPEAAKSYGNRKDRPIADKGAGGPGGR